ncbi:MAG TPA: hypothetical protein VIA18_13310 [Polyangia bacterium]|jgi:hypothetical protein|nr:hypothetical protein [Polyangia bacterium]
MDRKLCTLFALVTLAGCREAAKAPVNDTFSLVSDKSQPATNIATITYGTTTKPIKTRGDYGWLQLTGAIGDNVDIWVRSNDGDAVAFLLDSQDNIVAKNDDANATTTDAHISAPLAANGTYYIAFREYSYARASFTVSLAGRGIFTCAVDSDCMAVPQASCCPNGTKVAINTSEAEAYDVSYACTTTGTICPKYVVDDTRIAQCNAAAHACEMVQPANVVCGGASSHVCADGFTCAPDASGTLSHCVAND